MKYEAVYLYNNQNEFLGVSIKSVEGDRLHTVNIWTADEVEDFRKTLADLNDENILRQFWPDAMDPEVVKLVEDPEWEPLTLRKDSVINYDASTIVFVKEPIWGYRFDSTAGPIGPDGVPEGGPAPQPNPDTGVIEWKETQEIDHEASTFVYETREVPDPVEVQNRYFKAQETVARARAALATAE